ncbi:hypothetical protein [Hymenobacter crusticola]|uniref:Uncharacterized protein n=1 Tax=Hymenobacter crusticola TaxID=1770526 RepID=A0A243WEK8_9BACT|nr:hypothetical protein [Hymenobacter crusticola]OUJ74143.1 hypothetical protein BXP70_10410 [Hymenobacter crusticola]
MPTLAQAPARANEPQGRFLRPKVQVGEIIDYELSFAHAPSLDVIFPDSTAAFKPFEYVGKTYRPTRTRQGRSLDRTIYHLRTFSLDSVQQLSVPVTILRGNDTLTVATPPAVVRLARTAPIAQAEAPPVLRQDTALLPVASEFNYPYVLAAVGVLALAVAVLGLGFGRRLQQRYLRYKLRKNHVYFLAQYARHVERFTLSRSLTNMERAITLWKNYLTGLEDNGINSLTTKEIVALYQNDPDVRHALRLADKVIYANQFMEDEAETDLAFTMLRNFADRRYQSTITNYQLPSGT